MASLKAIWQSPRNGSEAQAMITSSAVAPAARGLAADPDAYLTPAEEKPVEPPAAAHGQGRWTCPMHPEIVRDGPGNCPICGMALEPAGISSERLNPELADMTRRFWIGAALAIPVVALDMGDYFPGLNLHHYVPPLLSVWIQFVLATPVVLWAGLPFFVRGWASVRNRSLNMFSLIALGVGAAYAYSLVATLAPGLFPDGLRQEGGPKGRLAKAIHGANGAESWDLRAHGSATSAGLAVRQSDDVFSSFVPSMK